MTNQDGQLIKDITATLRGVINLNLRLQAPPPKQDTHVLKT